MNLLENDNGSNLILIHHFEYHIAETIAFLKIKLEVVDPKVSPTCDTRSNVSQ